MEIEVEDVNIKDTGNTNKIENIFNYESNNIIIIMDKDMKVWCRARCCRLLWLFRQTTCSS